MKKNDNLLNLSQKLRMKVAFLVLLLCTGINAQEVTDAFTLSSKYVDLNEEIVLAAIEENANSYTWIVSNACITKSYTGKEVTFALEDGGLYDIMLEVKTDTETKNYKEWGFLHVIEGYHNNTINVDFSSNTTEIAEGENVSFTYTGTKTQIKLKESISLIKDYKMSISDKILANKTNWTYNYWFRIDELPVEVSQFAKKKGGDATDWTLRFTLDNEIQLETDGALEGDGEMVIPTNFIKEGEWNMYTFSYDGTTAKFYCNGSKTFEKAMVVTCGSSTTGNIFFSNGPYASSIDEFRIYNRALTDKEVATINMPKEYDPSLIFHVSCDKTLESSVGDVDMEIYLKKVLITNLTYVEGINWFFDESNNITYNWTFEGAETITSDLENPIVKYNEEGVYDVDLSVNISSNESTTEKVDYITVEKSIPNSIDNVKKQLNFYPNPTKDIIHIKGLLNENYQLYDILGKKIKSGIISEDKINISELKTGMYLIKVKDYSALIQKIN